MWHGQWFLEGEGTLVNISKQDFGTKGFCYVKGCEGCEDSSENENTLGQLPNENRKYDGSASDGKRYVIYNRYYKEFVS